MLVKLVRLKKSIWNLAHYFYDSMPGVCENSVVVYTYIIDITFMAPNAEQLLTHRKCLKFELRVCTVSTDVHSYEGYLTLASVKAVEGNVHQILINAVWENQKC